MVEGHLGIGTPYGALGVAFETDAVRELGFVAGGGLGFSGPQIAAGLRIRIPRGAFGLGGELVWSGGPYEWTDCHGWCLERDSEKKRWDFAHWLNLSPALEVRSQAGFSARFYAGVAYLLNAGDGECITDDCHDPAQIGFLGLALGGAL